MNEKFNELQEYTKINKAGLILVTETHIKKETDRHLSIIGYNIAYKNRDREEWRSTSIPLLITQK